MCFHQPCFSSPIKLFPLFLPPVSPHLLPLISVCDHFSKYKWADLPSHYNPPTTHIQTWLWLTVGTHKDSPCPSLLYPPDWLCHITMYDLLSRPHQHQAARKLWIRDLYIVGTNFLTVGFLRLEWRHVGKLPSAITSGLGGFDGRWSFPGLDNDGFRGNRDASWERFIFRKWLPGASIMDLDLDSCACSCMISYSWKLGSLSSSSLDILYCTSLIILCYSP